MNRALLVLSFLLTLFACKDKTRATVEGQLHGNGNKKLLIEQVVPGGTSKIIDTLTTKSDGTFSFSVDFSDDNPLFINVRTEDNFVPLLLAAGEEVSLSSVGNIYNNYEVKGSEGSIKLRELSSLTTAQTRALDSLSQLYNMSQNEEVTQQLGREYTRRYIALKRSVIRFVVSNPRSLSVIVPLYQPLIGGRYIFDEPTDIVYFRVVADSLEKIYPTSPYVKSLRADLERSQATMTMDSALTQGIEAEEINLPPLELKDAEGQLRKLSDLQGKVVLLDFTTIVPVEFKPRNRELSEIYEKYHERGFEIYQVALDINRAQWLRAVVDSRLRWISVNDFLGTSSPSLSSFNVKTVPANFLISRSGDIIGRNITGSALDEALQKAL